MAENEIHGFVAPASWPIRWHTSTADSVLTAVDSAGRFRVEKFADHTVHTVLNATPRDLKRLKGKRGVAVAGGSAFQLRFQAAVTAGLRAELVLHEFDGAGERLSREVLAAGSAADYVLMPETESLVASIRTVGQGTLTVETLEFQPAESADGVPGLRRTGRAESGSDNVPEDVVGSLMALRNALYSEVPLTAVLAKKEARLLTDRLVSHGHIVEAKTLIDAFALYGQLSTEHLQRVYGHARKTGYLRCASHCAGELDTRRGTSGEQTLRVEVDAEIAFLSDPWSGVPQLEDKPSRNAGGPVLHVVGMSFPEKQRGYSVRTKYIAETLENAGIPQLLVVPSGGNGGAFSERVVHEDDGTIQLAGPKKVFGNKGVWLSHNVQALYEVVTEKRPRALHAHSDFFNGLLALAVGRATGVPVVYEVRGFWEESFISRVAADEGWEDVEQALRMYQAPELYTFLVEAERRTREAADHVVTLAQTMRERILQLSPQMDDTGISLVPNAVAGDVFGRPTQEQELRSRLSIGENDVVLGYVTSLAAHEGIETLIDAYSALRQEDPTLPVKLLIVGDGAHGDTLRAYARERAEDAIFVGRVPHENILDYYHAIDIFVVPRKRTPVTELVTPLKPLEALAVGIPLIISDLSPLEELVKGEPGAYRSFKSGDASNLAEAIRPLVESTEVRRAMGERGRTWVRRERSWEMVVKMLPDIYSQS
ncbi:glycosyltransferase [Nesterenkonia populi]